MKQQHLFESRPELRGVITIAYGRKWIGVADGSHGKVQLECLAGEYQPPMNDPCMECEYRSCPECSTAKGCPTAEGWAWAVSEYERTAPR